MSVAVSLAGRIARNRQLKLLAAQSHHLAARFTDVFADAHLQTRCLNNRHFESTVYYPLSDSCTLRLASETAENPTESVERVRGAALSLFYSKRDLRHMLQAVESDVFVEFNATLNSMDAKAVVHLMRASNNNSDGVGVGNTASAEFMATVTAELPLVGGEEEDVCMAGDREKSKYHMRSDIALCNSSTGRCPRDAIKRGFALSLAELDPYTVEEQRKREQEAWCYLQSVECDKLQRDWESVALSAFLSGSLDGNCSSDKVKWLPLREETDTAQVALSSGKYSKFLSLSAKDIVGNDTLLTLPLHIPPLVFRRILTGDDAHNGSPARIAYSSALVWPEKWIVSTALMQLCSVLNTSICTVDTIVPSGKTADIAWTSQQISFSIFQALLNTHGVFPSSVPYSIERGLFFVNNLLAVSFTKQTDGERIVGDNNNNIPLICLKCTPYEVGKVGQEIHVELEVKPSACEVSFQTYRDFVTTIFSVAKKMMKKEEDAMIRRKYEEGFLRGASVMNRGLLGRVWRLLAAIVSLTDVKRRNLLSDISLWFPAENAFSSYQPQEQKEKEKELLGFIAQLFATDAWVSPTSSDGGTLLEMLTLSSASLEVQALPLCHTLQRPDITYRHLFHDISLRITEVGNNNNSNDDDSDMMDSRRDVEDAARERQMEQSCYYCPDLILMIQEMRLALHLPQRSFPTLEFFQRAVHDVPQRVHELMMGAYGDVPIYTRVVAHWGPSLRAEVESDMHGVTEKDNVYSFSSQQQSYHRYNHFQGPLRLLLSVVCSMYGRVFPDRTTAPLIALNSPTRRRSIDFLLYSWFMASPQVRCFEISTRTARIKAAKEALEQKRSDLAEKTLSHHVSDYIIRAMLFYDFCGQRVLFAETHAGTVGEAVRHLNKLAVSLNIPEQDSFPLKPKTQRASRRFGSSTPGFDSEVSVLLRTLTETTHSPYRLCFVRTNDSASSWLEGIVEVQVPFRQIRCAASVTKARGVIPAVALACREAIRWAGGEEVAGRAGRCAGEAGTIIPRDGFPRYSARFYTPANLLGEVLQGVAGRYHCTYSMDSHTREVVCLLHIDAVAGQGNAAVENSSFPLGVGRGSSKKTAWAAAALQAMQTNFPDVLEQVERHKKLCEILHRPDDLSRLGCDNGFTVAVEQNKNAHSGEGCRCIIAPQEPADAEKEICSTDKAPSVFECYADRGVDAYLAAADALLNCLRQRQQQCCESVDGEDGNTNSSFVLWDPTTNYGKSVWHACCGALGVAFGGKVSLRFEGGREDARIRESEMPMQVKLIVRTWSSTDNALLETPIHILHEKRIREYSRLATMNGEGGVSVEEVLFAATRLLEEGIGKYTDEPTRKNLQRLLNILQRLKEGELSCSRLNSRRRMESCIELTLGCQSRVVVRQVAYGMVMAELGIWLPGRDRKSRVPFVLATCTENTTGKALTGLEENVRRVMDSLWATAMRSCTH